MSCYAVKYGLHLLDTSCARQTVIALSSGEAGYYALTRGASAGLLVKGVYEEIGRRLLMICLTDSSAGKGVASRKGVGKVKHLSLKELWVQDAIEQKRFKVQKVGTGSNCADLGTKVLDGSRILQLLKLLPLKRGAVIASVVTFATGQGPDEQEGFSDHYFWLYFLIVYLLALYGFISLVSNMVN